MRKTSALLIVAVAAAAPAATVAASSVPVDPAAQARVDTALAAFDTTATDAGFVGDESPSDIYDPIGLAASEDALPYETCFSEWSGLVAEDGSFAGQVAGGTSQTFYFTDGDTLPDDGSQYDLDYFQGTTAILATDAVEDVTSMIDGLAGDELSDCVVDAFNQLAEDAGIDEFKVDSTASPLDAGDAGTLLRIELSGTQDGDAQASAMTLGIAVDGDVLAIATYASGELSSVDDLLADAVEAMLTAAAA